MPTRSELRQTFIDAVKSSGSRLTVFNGRHIDELHDNLPAVIVGFDAVEVTQDMSDNFRYTGDMTVLVMVGGSDDEVDDTADKIIGSVMASMRSMYPTVGCQLQSIVYDRELDAGVNAAVVTWSLEFADG
jgi:hypothetical protein